MLTHNATVEGDTVRVARSWLAAWNDHDIERLTTLFASDYEGTDVGQAAPHRGAEGLRRAAMRYLQAFPDLQLTDVETVVQGNRAVLLWRAQGTHQGRLMNIPPTGHSIEVYGVTFLTVERGQVKRAVYIWDVAGLLRAIKLLPEL